VKLIAKLIIASQSRSTDVEKKEKRDTGARNSKTNSGEKK
tara:strand:- start:585 stop:704 length:120 start_codon:yes stop_codon:yes gene_type:complete